MIRTNLLAGASPLGLLAADPTDSEPVAEQLGLAYGHAGEVVLELDLFCPTAPREAPRAGVVFVHGGGWHAGNREQFRWHARQLAAAGYVTCSVSYRLTGVAPYPACLDDVQRAVRWFRSRAAELNLDPVRVGAFGSSAGGHLVACLGTMDTRDASVTPDLADISSRVSCVVDYHGIHDFPSLPASKLATGACRDLFEGSLEERREVWEEASPLRYVDQRSAAMLLIHDPGDEVVPYAQSVELATALMRAERPVEYMPTPGSGHGFGYSPDNLWQQRTWPVATAWLARHLRP